MRVRVLQWRTAQGSQESIPSGTVLCGLFLEEQHVLGVGQSMAAALGPEVRAKGASAALYSQQPVCPAASASVLPVPSSRGGWDHTGGRQAAPLPTVPSRGL